MTSEKLQVASVRLRAPANQGTGYLVAPTTIATCHHVVESAGEGGSVDVVLPDRVVQARVLKAVTDTDCALLELDAPLADREPLPLAGRCEQGAQWDGYGFPHLTAGSGLPFFGMVLQPESLDDLQRPMVTLYSDMLAAGMAAPVHGLSGGPVVVGGAVVGHFSRVLGTPGAAGQPALGVVYAARAANVLALLGTPPAVTEAPAPRAAALAELIPPLGPGEFHAFISYRSSDRPFALRLYERLDGVGLRVFLDQRELVIGDALAGHLHEALAKSRCGIVLVSRGWVESPWCLEEGNAMVSRAINERGAFRVIPVRIDTSEVPPLFAGRLWLDFAGENVPSGRKLEQLIYAVLGRPAPPEGSVDAKVQITLTDATDEALRRVDDMTDEALRRVDDMLRDPTRFRRLADFLRRTGLPEVAVKLRAADALIGVGRLEAALEILPPAEQSLRARQLRALALSKSSHHEEARALLEPMFANQEVDAETGGILGGIYKRLWQATGDRGYLIKALDTYRITYAATGDAYVGINVAAMALLLDKRAESQRIAAMILEKLGAQPESTLDHWNLATVAEAYLIRGDVEKAAEWYEKAVARGLTHPQDIAVMRRQAHLLLEKLGQDPNALDSSLPVPPVIAFSGHMTDAPGRAIPRFPPSKVEAVRRAVTAWLRRHGGRVHAVCSAARGADLVFLEEVLAREGTATVILPFPAADFKQVSVGTGWDERFDTALANDRVEVRPPLHETLPPAPEQAEAFEQCNIAILDEAERLAQLFDDADPLLLTVWNGSPGDGSGGTAHAVSTWQQRGYRTETIDLSQL
jgi:tetratricopeptide (TPR) repeat protein